MSIGSTTRMAARISSETPIAISGSNSESGTQPKLPPCPNVMAEVVTATVTPNSPKCTGLGHHKVNTPHPATTSTAQTAINAVATCIQVASGDRSTLRNRT